MNPGQEKFLHFILERVSSENQEQAKQLLNESFSKQNDGTFNQAYLMYFIPKMLELIQSEHLEEVKGIMQQFQGNIKA